MRGLKGKSNSFDLAWKTTLKHSIFAGEKGYMGLKGEKGVIGSPGLQGASIKGDKGDMGTIQGLQGYSGGQGGQGAEGPGAAPCARVQFYVCLCDYEYASFFDNCLFFDGQTARNNPFSRFGTEPVDFFICPPLLEPCPVDGEQACPIPAHCYPYPDIYQA